MTPRIRVHLHKQEEISEKTARQVVRDWIALWAERSVVDKRSGVEEMTGAMWKLKEAIEAFEQANSGDHGK